MIKTTFIHLLWSSYSLCLGVLIPKLMGAEIYGKLISDLSYAFLVVSVSQSLITFRLFSSVDQFDKKSLSIINFIVILFLSIIFIIFWFLGLFDLVYHWYSVLFIWSFVAVEIYKRILFHQANFNKIVFYEIIFRVFPLTYSLISITGFESLVLSLFIGNLLYVICTYFDFTRKYLNVIDLSNLLLNIKKFLKQGLYLLKFNIFSAMLTFYFIRLLNYNESIALIGVFFALKNITAIVSPVLQWYESLLTRKMIHYKKDKIKLVLKWLFYGIIFLTLAFLFIWIIRSYIFEFLNIKLNEENGYILLVLIIGALIEFSNKPLTIYMRHYDLEKIIAKIGVYTFVIGLFIYPVFIILFDNDNYAIPLLIIQLIMFIFLLKSVIYENTTNRA